MATVSEQRLADYLAEHPGRKCGQCGTSWEKCTEKVLSNRGACCGRCRLTDTHGNNAAEAALRRRRQQEQEALAAGVVEGARERVRAFLDAWEGEQVGPGGVTRPFIAVGAGGVLTVTDLRTLLAALDGEQR